MYCNALLLMTLHVVISGSAVLRSEQISQRASTDDGEPCAYRSQAKTNSAAALWIESDVTCQYFHILEKISYGQSSSGILANLGHLIPDFKTTLVPYDGKKRRSATEAQSFDPSLFPLAVPYQCLASSEAALEYVQQTLKPILLQALLSFPQTVDDEIVLLQRMNLLLRNDNFIRLMDGGGLLLEHTEEMENIFFMLMALPFFAVHTSDQTVLGWGVLTYLEGLSAFDGWLNWSNLSDKVGCYYCDESLMQALERAYVQFSTFAPDLRHRLAGISLVFFSPRPLVGARSILDVVREHRTLLAAASLAAINEFNAMDEHEQQNILRGSSLLLQAEEVSATAKSTHLEISNAGQDQVFDYALSLLEQMRNMNFVPKGSLNVWYCHPKLVLGSRAIESVMDRSAADDRAGVAHALALDKGQQVLWEKQGLLMASLNSLEGQRTYGNRRWRPQEIRLLSDFMESNASPDSGITMLGQTRPVTAVVGLNQDIMNRPLNGEKVPTAVALAAGIVVMPTGAGWFRFGNFGHEFSHLFEKHFSAEQLSSVLEAYRRIQGKGYYTAYFETNVHEALAELMGNWYENSQAVLDVARVWNDPDFWRMVHAAAYASVDASGRPRVRLWKISLADSCGFINYKIQSRWEPVLFATNGLIAEIGDPGLSPVERIANTTRSSFLLAQNFPNPFNPTTHIEYELERPASLQLTIYDALGLEIRRLADERRSVGRFTAVWDGTDEAGRPCASGTYFYRLQTGDFVQTKKMVLLR
jgi:hypothetical protein